MVLNNYSLLFIVLSIPLKARMELIINSDNELSYSYLKFPTSDVG